MLPLVAIIGKPNVGKSTLFNRFAGFRKAVVSPTPGTTRDRHYAQIKADKPFFMIDTGGIESKSAGVIEDNIVAQAQMAIEEADLILFLIDAKEGVTSEDQHVADLLRKCGKKIILIASKCDSQQENVIEMLRFGFGEPIMVSAIHLLGMPELEDTIESYIEKVEEPEAEEKKNETLKLAIMGRPNMGKSSLINSLLGKEKLIVSDIAGTTIDSTDIDFEFEDEKFTLVDTAGIRRRGKIEKGIEKYSFLRSLRAAEKADVCVLMIDGSEGITSQDQHIASYMLDYYPGVILAVNKLDLMEKGSEARDEFAHQMMHKFEFMPWAPVVFISAKNGKNIEQILKLASEIKKARYKRIETSKINKWIEKTMIKHMPTGTGRKIPKLFYISQVDVDPPHFVMQVNKKEYFHFSYMRYLENQLRDTFGFEGTAIKFHMRNKETRYNKKKTRPKKS
ncbi:MAG: ribosome biogenesis GTPase Der [Candidatus Gracilibacteria bacterium]|nr:ribosome biogenesis GTPase Der [Candidatus Gracilibacteria bacterium]